jgi:hypothetical protein
MRFGASNAKAPTFPDFLQPSTGRARRLIAAATEPKFPMTTISG